MNKVNSHYKTDAMNQLKSHRLFFLKGCGNFVFFTKNYSEMHRSCIISYDRVFFI